jgi:MAF protein
VTGSPLLVLASNSPRRQQLLALIGWQFSVQPVEVDESTRPAENAEAYVVRLASAKAVASAVQLRNGQAVLAADTAVVDGMAILGKPSDANDAQRMLEQLRGRAHRVCTAIAVLRAGQETPLIDVCVSKVSMRFLTDAEISAYIATGDALDKAGAYAIQHPVLRPVEAFGGCFPSVMGLPLCHLMRTMKRLGIPASVDVPVVCQRAHNYNCSIHGRILRGEQLG